MLEKMILNVAINIIYLGPVDWVRDFTNKLDRQAYSDSLDFFSTLASLVPSSVARHHNGPSLDRMRTRDKVCLYMHNFNFFMYI